MVASGPKRAQVPALRFQGKAYHSLLAPMMLGDYGAVPRETLLEGPTGTGKSLLLGGLTRVLARRFPGINILVLRKVKADLAGSFMQMWEEEILRWDDPWDRYMLAPNGRIPSARSRDFYAYPNGAKIWCRGMDQWARVKSMAYDFIWMMEGTEFEEKDLMGLHTRIRKRRHVNVPWRGLISDVNPEHPEHWWNKRAAAGDCARIRTTLRDNPGFFDMKAGRYTPDGQEYIDGLRAQLKGHMAQRYIDGEWVAATGQILDFDKDRHVFRADIEQLPGQKARLVFGGTHPVLGDFVELEGFAASYDWGKRHAGTLQIWGIDSQKRQYLVEEVYHSEKPLHWWADWAVTLWKKYGLQFIVCDSAADDTIKHFNHELQKVGGAKARIAIPCDKRSGNREASNLEVLDSAFSSQLDGKPAVYIREGALAHAPDMDLKAKCLQDEIPSFIYAEHEPSRHSGRPEERPARNCVDDGLDACCYMRVHLMGGHRIRTKYGVSKAVPDALELWEEDYWRNAS